MKQISYFRYFIPLLMALFNLNLAAQDFVENSDIYQGKADITHTKQVVLKPGFRATEGCNVHVYIDENNPVPVINYQTVSVGELPPSYSSGGMNYIRTVAPRVAVSGDNVSMSNLLTKLRTETINYFDGLGRPLQTINVMASPLQKDIVTPIVYDQFGREDEKYFPYVSVNSNGNYNENSVATCINYYEKIPIEGRVADAKPFTDIVYEASPLNRIIGEKGPGTAWKGHLDTIIYKTNTEPLRNWKVQEQGTTISYPQNDFLASKLYVTEYIDENHHVSREYKDFEGRVVCKESIKDNTPLRTHYIYDDFGLLRCVVPPKASGPTINNLCYYYRYDERRRMVEKTIPGAGTVSMVYDQRDRLVLTQDEKLRSEGRWLATLYDQLNRPVITAFILNLSDPSVFKTSVITASRSQQGAYFNYSVSGLPAGVILEESNVQTVNYYDNYDNFASGTYGFIAPPINIPDYSAMSSAAKSLVTGTITRVIVNEDVIADQMLLTVNYYDAYQRVIQTVSDNHLGGTDRVFSKYNFVGQPEISLLEHKVTGKNDFRMWTEYLYDHQGRLLSEEVKLNDQQPLTVAAMQYNELGELRSKYLHGSNNGDKFNQKIDYNYNIRGWLTNMNTPGNLGNNLYGFDLRYNNPDPGDGLNSSAQFNGNISEMRWQSKGNEPKGYGFTYDQLNRLLTADYAQGSSYNTNNDAFNSAFGYDNNGNINALTRYKDSQLIDNLSYAYIGDGNRLQSVTDHSQNSLGYPKGINEIYRYDANGNMNFDPSKGFSINYNYLNLPAQVSIGNDNLRYAYSAAGTKLRKVVAGSNSENNTRLDYSGPFIYENNTLKCIFTSVGRIVPVNTGNNNVLYKFEYNLSDHLGNVGVSFAGHSNGVPEVMQLTDYYPFGLVMNQQNFGNQNISLQNKYLYNGKELQNDALGGIALDWYDYGARMYDPVIGRWHTVDPLAQNYYSQSPYHFSGNNPLKFLDLNGMNYNPYYDQNTGDFLGVDENGFAGQVMVSSSDAYNSAKKNNDGSVSSESIQKNSDTKSFDEVSLSKDTQGKILTHIVNQSLEDGNNINGDIKIKVTDGDYNFTARDASPSNLDIKASSWQASYETTVENVRNSVNQHEVNGHVLKGISGFDHEHYKAYQMQVDHPSFKTTTLSHQASVMSLFYKYANYGGVNILNNPKYNSLFYNSGGYQRYIKWYNQKYEK